MTEDEARGWLLAEFGPDRFAALERFVALLIDETHHQNLISPSTVDQIWCRHIVDSAQLVKLAPADGMWLDIGSGAGLPGLVVSVLRDTPVVLVEPRKRRTDFLSRCIEALGLEQTKVRCCRVEALRDQARIISARAVGGIEQLFAAAANAASNDTLWLLPRGASGSLELAHSEKSWHGTFHVEQSLTHSDSTIVVARGVRRR